MAQVVRATGVRRVAVVLIVWAAARADRRATVTADLLTRALVDAARGDSNSEADEQHQRDDELLHVLPFRERVSGALRVCKCTTSVRIIQYQFRVVKQ